MALFEVHTFDPAITPARRICVSEHVAALLRDEGNERAGYLLDDLDRFLKGNIVTISMQPRDAKTAFMGLLDPAANCKFDIRSRDPSPALRIIGAFRERDFFIGLVLRVRRIMNEPDWVQAIDECDELWRLHFHDSPLTGSNPSVFLTNWYCVD